MSEQQTKPETSVEVEAAKGLLQNIHTIYDQEIRDYYLGAEPDIDQGQALVSISSLAVAVGNLLDEIKRLTEQSR